MALIMVLQLSPTGLPSKTRRDPAEAATVASQCLTSTDANGLPLVSSSLSDVSCFITGRTSDLK